MHRQENTKRADAGASQMAGISIGGVTKLITSSQRAHHFAWRYLDSRHSTTAAGVIGVPERRDGGKRAGKVSSRDYLLDVYMRCLRRCT